MYISILKNNVYTYIYMYIVIYIYMYVSLCYITTWGFSVIFT